MHAARDRLDVRQLAPEALLGAAPQLRRAARRRGRRARTARARRRPRSAACGPPRTRAGGRSTSRRACGGTPPRDPSSRRCPRSPRRRSALSVSSRISSAVSYSQWRAIVRAHSSRRSWTSGAQRYSSGLPVEGELVGGRPELGGGELVQRPRVPDLVLRDGRERDVLLEERRDPGPLRVSPAEEELVVGDREQEVRAVAHGRLRHAWVEACPAPPARCPPVGAGHARPSTAARSRPSLPAPSPAFPPSRAPRAAAP